MNFVGLDYRGTSLDVYVTTDSVTVIVTTVTERAPQLKISLVGRDREHLLPVNQPVTVPRVALVITLASSILE